MVLLKQTHTIRILAERKLWTFDSCAEEYFQFPFTVTFRTAYNTTTQWHQKCLTYSLNHWRQFLNFPSFPSLESQLYHIWVQEYYPHEWMKLNQNLTKSSFHAVGLTESGIPFQLCFLNSSENEDKHKMVKKDSFQINFLLSNCNYWMTMYAGIVAVRFSSLHCGILWLWPHKALESPNTVTCKVLSIDEL